MRVMDMVLWITLVCLEVNNNTIIRGVDDESQSIVPEEV